MKATLNDQTRFPVGTTVKAYPASNWPQSKLPPSGAPVGAAMAETVVAADGSIVFEGLAEKGEYYAGGQVGTEWRYVHYRASVAGEGTVAGAVLGQLVTVAASNAPNHVKAGATYVCDGAGDEVEINEAIASLSIFGGRVELSEGHFFLNAAIAVTKDNVALVGRGKGQPLGATPVKGGTLVIRGAGFAGTEAIRVQPPAEERVLFGVTLQDFSLDGLAVAGAVDGLKLRTARSTFRNLWVTRWGGNGIAASSQTFAVYPKASHDNLVENVRIDECQANGMSFTNGSTDNLIRNCIVTRSGEDGIRMNNGATPSTANMLMGNYLYSNTGKAISGPLYQTQLVGNRIEDCNGGIYLDQTVAGAGGFQITNNILRNCSLAADNTTDGINIACTAGTARGGLISDNAFHTDPGADNAALNRMRFGINIASANLTGVTIGAQGSGFREATSCFGTASLQNLGTGTVDVGRPSAAASQAAGQGLVAQNFDRQLTVGTSIMVGGTAYGMMVPFKEGDRIGNLYVNVGTAGNATTMFKAEILSLDGATQHAKSADQSALFGTAGVKTIPLTGTWVVPATGTYVVVIVATATTTLPTLWRGSTSASETKIGAAGRPYMTAGTGLADVPAVPAAFSVNNAPIAFWVGASA